MAIYMWRDIPYIPNEHTRGYWDLVSDFKDKSGNGRDLLAGNESYNFDGGVFNATGSLNLKKATDEYTVKQFTVSFWIYIVTGSRYLFRYNSGNNFIYQTTQIRFLGKISGYTRSITSGEWVHYVLMQGATDSYSSGYRTLTSYVNGEVHNSSIKESSASGLMLGTGSDEYSDGICGFGAGNKFSDLIIESGNNRTANDVTTYFNKTKSKYGLT